MKSKLYGIYKYVRRRPNLLIVSTMKLRSYYCIYIDAFGALSFCSICHTSPPPSFYHVAGSGYGYRFGHQNLPEFSRNICGDDTRAHTHTEEQLWSCTIITWGAFVLQCFVHLRNLSQTFLTQVLTINWSSLMLTAH